jgi:hypothetical protein
MIPEEKIVEIKRKLRKGYPQGELINDLSNEGYTAEDIQSALFNLEGPKKDQKIKDLSLWYLASICFIILGIAILSVKYLWIYYYGYVFLILGLAGLLVKYFIIDSGNKK